MCLKRRSSCYILNQLDSKGKYMTCVLILTSEINHKLTHLEYPWPADIFANGAVLQLLIIGYAFPPQWCFPWQIWLNFWYFCNWWSILKIVFKLPPLLAFASKLPSLWCQSRENFGFPQLLPTVRNQTQCLTSFFRIWLGFPKDRQWLSLFQNNPAIL